MACETLVKPTCLEAQHETHDLLEDAKECQRELDEILKGFKTGDAMRGRVDGVLRAKLKALETQIEENYSDRQKIQLAIVKCQEMAKLSSVMKASTVIGKKLEQMKKEMKYELEQAKIFLDCVALSPKKVFKAYFLVQLVSSSLKWFIF